jgi:hypothetical protein
MTKERIKQCESKLFNYYSKEDNGPAWHLHSVEITEDLKEVKVAWIHKSLLIGSRKFTYTYPMYKLPEEYTEAVNALQIHIDSTGRTYTEFGEHATVFGYNEKIFVMVRDGRVVKSND